MVFPALGMESKTDQRGKRRRSLPAEWLRQDYFILRVYVTGPAVVFYILVRFKIRSYAELLIQRID
jgi:hypothetical protein